MARCRRALLLLSSLGVASTALADIPVPHQELCTKEIQEQDGSQCESCSWVGYEQGAFEAACGPLEARGLTRRCGYGATAAVAVYCDREANWIEVGQGMEATMAGVVPQPVAGGGCSCRTHGGAHAGWFLVLLAAFARRRR
ncbi:MAG: MYXO-CTERM sorting domain-containing protein [Myxococcota bacterium]